MEPAINRDGGSTLAFSKAQARKMLDAPPTGTPEGEPPIAGPRDASTTKLYDRRGYDPEKASSFFATC